MKFQDDLRVVRKGSFREIRSFNLSLAGWPQGSVCSGNWQSRYSAKRVNGEQFSRDQRSDVTSSMKEKKLNFCGETANIQSDPPPIPAGLAATGPCTTPAEPLARSNNTARTNGRAVSQALYTEGLYALNIFVTVYFV